MAILQAFRKEALQHQFVYLGAVVLVERDETAYRSASAAAIAKLVHKYRNVFLFAAKIAYL